MAGRKELRLEIVGKEEKKKKKGQSARKVGSNTDSILYSSKTNMVKVSGLFTTS